MQITMIHDLSDINNSLAQLLKDCVASGASVGFIDPVSDNEVNSYWQNVAQGIADQERVLFVALDEGEVLGSVQLALCKKANGRHRGEVEKLMVHRNARGKGIATQLLNALEQEAMRREQSLLVLDTRVGDVASLLYRKVGYIEAGQIPNYAMSSQGELSATVYFYKLLA